MLMSHTDVVAVEADKWTQDPFGGNIVDGFIYGRGALDMKNMVAMELQTMLLLKRLNVPLIRRVVAQASAGETIPRETQDETGRRYYRRGAPRDGWIDWSEPAERVAAFDQARGAARATIGARRADPSFAATLGMLAAAADVTPHAIVFRTRNAAIAAADVIAEIYARGVTASRKSDGSPVTEADSRAEEIIIERLAHFGLPVLAEESVSAGRIPALGERFFVVDPLDGTREFLSRNGEFTVNIALIHQGRAELGVVHVPVSGVSYFACTGGGAGIAADMQATTRLGCHPAPVISAGASDRAILGRSRRRAKIASLRPSISAAPCTGVLPLRPSACSC